jgi:mono/diheme cytochrome c family protein
MNLFRQFAVGTAGLALVSAAVAANPAASKPIDFKRDVQPIFASRCAECHGEKKDKAGVRFDRRNTVFQGGDAGKPLVVPGNSAGSLLFRKVTSDDPNERMPAKGEPLTEAQIATLRNWIDQGASWPEDAAATKKHWAYVKPSRPALPKVSTPNWCRNDLDRFVLARLDQEKLKPAPEADRALLLRRVSLDLTGLPPTLEEVDAFLADSRSDAYERVVDRLLDSPAYGERWARPWLDLARYADTQGYEKDAKRTMWPYRDWVIQALNRNMPFDQFTIEQLAGDLLPDATQDQRVATGFHRNTMTNTEGGTDNEEFRYEAVIDRINTTFGAWMGSTLNCAQCHNHKYDPFTTVEYYRVMAFLNNTEDADADDEKPTMKVFKDAEQKQKLTQLRDEEKAAENKLNDAVKSPDFQRALADWEKKLNSEKATWDTLDPVSFKSEGGATLRKNNTKSIIADGVNPSNDTYIVSAPVGPGKLTGIRLEALETGEEKALGRHANGGFVLRKFELSATPHGVTEPKEVTFQSVVADFSQKKFEVSNLLTGEGDGWAVETMKPENKVRRSAYFALKEPLDLPEGGSLTFTLRHSDKHPGANLKRFRLYSTSSAHVAPPASLPEEIRNILAIAPEKRDKKQAEKLTEHYRALDPVTKSLHEAHAAAKKAADEFDKTIPISSVMVELAKARVTKRHIRGAYLNTAEEVQPGTPACLHPFPAGQPTNRLGFARWVVSPENPLTARVIMNRIWEQYFGRGIVETVEEFGKQGEAPSHPELLDWLACEFMNPVESLNRSIVKSGSRSGQFNDSTIQRFNDSTIQPWSLKHMHRLIATSATYRQSSKVPPALAKRDPYNRLLARGPRVRLEAEMVRDQALAVAGLLSHKVGGPSVMPPQPDGIWQVVYNGETWKTSPGEDKYRRGLYTFWRRTMPHPMMVNFDAPSREFCVLKRSRSNTPLQALNTLNDPEFIECAQAIARKVAAQPAADVRVRATHALRLVLARAPQPKEVERLVALFQSELKNYENDAQAAEKMAASELGKPKEPCNLAELAAWTVVANVLLNLDETITKG